MAGFAIAREILTAAVSANGQDLDLLLRKARFQQLLFCDACEIHPQIFRSGPGLLCMLHLLRDAALTWLWLRAEEMRFKRCESREGIGIDFKAARADGRSDGDAKM